MAFSCRSAFPLSGIALVDERFFCHGFPRLQEMVQVPRQLNRRAGQSLY
jgi:hypothetical protein